MKSCDGIRLTGLTSKTIERDDGFRDDGNLMLLCSEREVNVQEYRQVLEDCLNYRNRVRARLMALEIKAV